MKARLDSQVDQLYYSMSCGSTHGGVFDLSWQEVYQNIEQLYLDIARGKVNAEELNEDFVNSYVNRLSKAFQSSVKSNFTTPSYGEPNYEFIRQVRTNLFQFAGAKTYRELKALNNLFMKKGKVVPFSEFQRNVELYRSKVQGVQETYRKSWLQAEYNHAIRTAQSAERWQEAEELRDIYPNLQYLATMDTRVRDEHRKLHKVIRPIDDPFWDKFTPPNGWNCRCRVESTRQQPTTGAPEIKTPVMFQNNPAKTGVVFPEKHPFYPKQKDIREKVNARSDEFALSIYKDQQRKVYNGYSDSLDYTRERFDSASGGYLIRHRNSGKLSAVERSMIDELVAQGDGVIVKARTEDPFTSNPDIQIRGTSFEMKDSVGSATSIRDRIVKTSSQGKFVVIRIPNTSNLENGIQMAVKKIDDSNSLSGVLVLSGGKRFMIDRQHLYREGGVKEMIKKQSS